VAPGDGQDVELRSAAVEQRNLKPVLVEPAPAHVNDGEIVHRRQDVWGGYRETPVF